MTDQTFKLDNVIIQTAPTLFGKRNPQLYLPGMEPFGPFDLWVVFGCYSLLNPKKPTDPVVVTLTDFLEILDFSRTLSEALGFYRTFPSDAYALVRESLHRLFTVEAVYRGEWSVKTGKRGRPKRQVVEYHSRILSSYAYIYPPDVIPPDQLPEAKRRNVNKAKTTRNEEGPPIYQYKDGPRPEAIQFRISEELLRGLTRTDPHIGATTLRLELFKLRRPLANKHAAVRLLLWVARQTKKSPAIGLDKLCRRLNIVDPKGRNVQRTRDDLVAALALLQELGVVEGFAHDPQSDVVTVTKAEAWHFPTRDDEDEGLLEEGKG